MKGRMIFFLPLAVAGLLFGMFIYRLAVPGETLIQSQWIGKPLPLIDLPPATDGVAGLKSADISDGKPRLVNVFASWCGPCIVEAPHLKALQSAGVEIVGIAVRDRPADVARFLAEHGNPYARIGADEMSSVQIALGSSGVPETFLIDGKGIIRKQHQGVILADDVPDIIRELESIR